MLFPPHLVELLDWEVGDTLRVYLLGDDSIILRSKKQDQARFDRLKEKQKKKRDKMKMIFGD